MIENRIYLVIPTSITSSIDYSEIYETSGSAFRISANGEKTIIKYDSGSRPSFYSSEYIEYTHEGIKQLLMEQEWVIEDEPECDTCP